MNGIADASNEKSMAKKLLDIHTPVVAEWRDAALKEAEECRQTEGHHLVQKFNRSECLFPESDIRVVEDDLPSVQCGGLTQLPGTLNHSHTFFLPHKHTITGSNGSNPRVHAHVCLKGHSCRTMFMFFEFRCGS
jgi:hypothetical protein